MPCPAVLDVSKIGALQAEEKSGGGTSGGWRASAALRSQPTKRQPKFSAAMPGQSVSWHWSYSL